MTDEQILEKVVALTAERAKEEASGLIRWLRPAYQNPGGKPGRQGELAVPVLAKGPKPKKRAGKQPWPKSIAEKVRALDQLIHAEPAPGRAEEVAKAFARANASGVADIPESLVAIGKAHKLADGGFAP
jgi:hypothetical protein